MNLDANTAAISEGLSKASKALRAYTTAVMTAIPGLLREPNRSMCGRCRGKGFDCFEKNRASRRCARCKGRGSTAVGSTKR